MSQANTSMTNSYDFQKDSSPAEQSIRIEDYLNDKIQTTTDLRHLESLIANVESQHRQLEEQLQDAQSKLAEARNASTSRASAMLERTREFEREQASVQKRLMIVTNSDTPEEALSRLKRPMEKLRKLELAHGYIDLLNEIEHLKGDAKRHLPEHPKMALGPYTQLKELSMSLQQLQEPAEGAAVHLVAYVQQTSEDLWAEMKKIMSDDLEAVLQKTKWPDPAYQPTAEWTDSFEKLLDLQSPEIMAATEPLILLPMSALAKSFILQFKYHFFSDKATNHPHRLGDYFFEWFLGTVGRWEVFLRENLGPILASHFRNNSKAGNSLYVDPVSAFITALLPILQEKVQNLMAEIQDEPHYLSRFVVQMMTFDDAVRSRFGYDAGYPEFGWKGVTWPVLDTWFDTWFEAEKKFTLERYKEIINNDRSGQIDFDSSAPGKTKPTYGAIQVTELVATVTTQYSRLRKFSHKVRFLIGIQAEVLDRYLGRLNDALEAYQTATSTVGRAIHGVTKEQQAELQGVHGLDRLCRVFGSSEYLTSMLKTWSNEEFFVELYDQLQGRAMSTSDSEAKLAGEMSFTEVKEATSNTVGSEEDGSLFDVTIESAERLRKRAEALITQAIKYNFPTVFRPYITKPQWTTIGDAPSQASTLAITSELDTPLSTLRASLTFTRRALSDAAFRRIWRDAFDSLQDLLYHEVLLRQDFTSLGAARFVQDLAAIQSVVEACMPRSPLSMSKLQEAATLLGLPVELDDDNDGDGNISTNDNSEVKRKGEGMLTLEEVTREVFASNAQAKDVLDRLGCTHLSNAEARAVLKRRIEANSD